MLVRSLALTTELGLAVTRGRITDRGDYLVVETPDDPGYYHGNVLVLPAPPQVGEVAYWSRKFTAELGDLPAITLWWDDASGDVGAADELRAAGFTIEINQVMIADEVLAPPIELAIRALDPDEVLATAELAWAIGDRHDESYRQFLHRRASWHRGLVTRGAATFWGAHDGDTLAASLGLVPIGKLARYQDVQTAPAYRRRGLAGALLVAAARHALAIGVDRTAPPFGGAAGRAHVPAVDRTAPPFSGAAGRAHVPAVDRTAPPFGGAAGRAHVPAVERVVIIAEPGSAAARVYERVGFRTVERTASACRYPPGVRVRPPTG